MAKKIGAIASLSIIGVLIIATIIMANIRVDYSINCSTPDKIYVNNVLVDTTEQSNKIVELINNASKENYLSALFNGNLGKAASVSSVTGTKTVPSTSNFYVEYVYNNPQTLMVGKDKYEDNQGNSYTYERLFFTVNSTEGEAKVNVYVIADSDAPSTYTHYYELEANFYDLYNYLQLNFND